MLVYTVPIQSYCITVKNMMNSCATLDILNGVTQSFWCYDQERDP